MKERVRMWIKFDGIVNARDLGGIPAADGRKVKPGRLLRGAGLDKASDADIARLQNEFHLRHVIDLRDERECAMRPNREIPGAQAHLLPVMKVQPPRAPMDTVPDFDALFRRLYGNMAESDDAAAAYREMFNILLSCREGAVYFHCAQGKDRTGIASLLILSALGVEEETAKEDYFLSNIGLKDSMADPESMGVRPWPEETIRKLFTVSPVTLDAYLSRIRDNWGGIENYLRGALGLTDAGLQQLRRDYLE